MPLNFNGQNNANSVQQWRGRAIINGDCVSAWRSHTARTSLDSIITAMTSPEEEDSNPLSQINTSVIDYYKPDTSHTYWRKQGQGLLFRQV
jgi:hypothetical protein